MAATRSTRKTAAAKPETDAAAAETNDQATAEETSPAAAESGTGDETAPAPDAAPLEPPQVAEPPAAPATPAYATPTEVIPDEENLAEVILDDATKEPPADIDSVFQPITPYGSTLVCTVRLVERTYLGPHNNPIHRLLQPRGATVSEYVAARITDRLIAQAATAADNEK